MTLDTFFMILFVMVVVHALSDWCWQSRFIAENKDKVPLVMFMHCIAWTGCLAFILYGCELFCWWKIIFLFGGHWIVDYGKSKILYGKQNNLCSKAREDDPKFVKYAWRLVYVDQFIHLIQIIIVILF